MYVVPRFTHVSFPQRKVGFKSHQMQFKPIHPLHPQLRANLSFQDVKKKMGDLADPYVRGSKLLYGNLKKVYKLREKNPQQWTREDHRLKLHTMADLKQALPILGLFALPIVGYLAPVLVYLFPKLLPESFQKDEIRQQMRQTQQNTRDSLRKVILTQTVFQLQSDKSQLSHKDQKELKVERLDPYHFIEWKSSFEPGQVLHFDSLDRSHLEILSEYFNATLTSSVPRFYIKNQLENVAKQILADDQMINEQGSVTDEEAKDAIYERGLLEIKDGLLTEKATKQFTNWLNFSFKYRNVLQTSPSLTLHCLVLFNRNGQK
eukprot:TRINITY_DN2906_c0_g1_i1.p1 TRINITY_DN2906_c0_g1~~TRINITY_DN2906_c0_g1_i1.p1  ORF type:complete len:319 (-),score=59.63 TRINITY_DN2906_c0_g1_i1:17-973(-)